MVITIDSGSQSMDSMFVYAAWRLLGGVVFRISISNNSARRAIILLSSDFKVICKCHLTAVSIRREFFHNAFG
jgi:hypothetical protein